MTAAKSAPRAALVLGLLAALALAGCAAKRRGEPVMGQPVASSASLERGRTAFEQHCYKCHTQGEGGMGPIINDKPLPRFLMRLQVRHGLGAMPAFPPERLSDEDLEAVLDYIVALRRGAGR